MMKHRLFLRSVPFLFGLLLGVTGTTLLAVSGGSTRFSDIPPGAYYDQAVGDLVDAGIIKGFPDGTFGPGKLVTRADIAVMLQRLRNELRGVRTSSSSSSSSSLSSTSSSSSSLSSAASSFSSSSVTVTSAGTVRFTIGTYSVRENMTSTTISVVRTGGNKGSVAVNYAVAGGTAVSGTDYTGDSGTLTFGDGETSRTFVVTMVNDTASEGNETVQLTLSSPTGGLVLSTPSSATLTILDDEISSSSSSSAAPSSSGAAATSSTTNAFVFSAHAYEVSEASGSLVVTVNRLGSTSGGVSVNYATSDSTAKAGTDYTVASGTLTFATGETSKTFTVSVTDDGNIEGNKLLNLKLSAPTGGVTLGNPSAAILTIGDNEITSYGFGTLKFTESNYRVTEDEGSAAILVQRAGGTQGTVTVQYATSNAGAQSGLDYTAASGTLTFLPGESKKAFSVPLLTDLLPDPEEKVSLTLSTPTGGATLGTPSGAFITIFE